MGPTVSVLKAGIENVYLHEAGVCVRVFEANEQLSMSVDPTVDIYIAEADKDSLSVREAEGVSRNEYLHEGGWQNVYKSLHGLEFVQNEMHSFYLDQEHLEYRQCTMCKEPWPTRPNLASQVYICFRCKRDKKSPKKFTVENNMDPGIVNNREV